jgi:hypothetical protein
MPSLTLKGIPEDLMERLRRKAESERRSINQQAIQLLDEALRPTRTFKEAYEEFLAWRGESALEGNEFEGLRDRSPMRDSNPFE